MKKTKILVLGNDPQINDIDFSKISPKVITLGINRIWLKHLPNYLFFNDYHIIEELEINDLILQQLIQKSVIFSSDWIRYDLKKRKVAVPPWVQVHDRINKIIFPDSVTTAMPLLLKKYPVPAECTFYIAGVSLKWQEPSHFWKGTHDSKNKYSEKWYTPRFSRILENFRYLKRLGFEMVSVNPNSSLNKIMRYENIENLYL